MHRCSRSIRRSVLAAGAILVLAPAAAAASPDRAPRSAGDPSTAIKRSQAPAGLEAAVRSALGTTMAPATKAGTASTSTAPANSIFEQAKLAPSDLSAGDGFGVKVWINGTIAVVGAPYQSSDQGAAYVFVRSGSTWSEQAKLTAPDGAPGDYFGGSAGVERTTVVVGARGHDGGTGAAYVFLQGGHSWNLQAELMASDGAPGDQFGSALGIDGQNVLVGAPDKDSGVGAAYAFHRVLTAWTQQAELTAPDGTAGDYFGSSVAIHGPEPGGPTTVVAAVGAPYKSSDAGAVYVFDQDVQSKTWPYQVELTPSDPAAGDYFGWSVGVWGLNLVVGAPYENSATGVAYVFRRLGRSATAWSQQAELTASDGAAGDMFGAAVAMSHSTAVVGAPDRNSDTGAAYVFTKSGAAWPQVTELTASDGAPGDYFGDAVSISTSEVVVGASGQSSSTGAAYTYAIPYLQAELAAADGAASDNFGISVALSGSTAVVGAPGHNSSQGAVYVFTGSGFHWSLQTELTASDGVSGDQFGRSIALYGSTLVVGAPGRSAGAGAAYVFVEASGAWQQQAELTPSDPVAGDSFGSSVAIQRSTVAVGAPGKSSGAGAAYVFAQSGSSWLQQAELTASDQAAGDHFGDSVAASGSTVIVGAPGHSSTGAAYVFQFGTSWSQRTELTAPDGVANDEFGWAVAMFGSTVVIGAPNHASTGASYVFGGSGSDWTEQGELDGGGYAVAIYASTIVVGSPNAYGTGAAYLYTPVDGVWVGQAQLTAPDAITRDQLGTSVAVNGSTGFFGAPNRKLKTGVAYMFTNL